ncbi:MAG: class I tRNA ligase family protein, partial [Patescibacteria group bacterium]
MSKEEKTNSDNTKSEIALKEEAILKFWQENQIFEKTLAQTKDGPEFVFYDGPPFATGLPHYGHILAGTIKDVIPRYQTMKGRPVKRRWGWDCHGLPAENLVEAKLKLKSKQEIEDYGVALFNEEARAMVLEYVDDWKKIVPRLGRFVDMENDYRTMDSTYTETVMWIFKTLHDKGLIYEGYKSMQICPRCETTLSNFEVNQGYKDIPDISVTVKFELMDEPKKYVLAWTTTPWTLPGNVALAVNPEIDYVEVSGEVEGNIYVVAGARVKAVFGDNYKILKTFKGSELLGKSYKPAFDYYVNDENIKNRENSWKIYGADFVTTEDGTGVVHIAPAFGEDDMKLGQKENLPFIQPVAMNGRFKPEVTDWAGEQVKPKDDPQKMDIEILKYLAAKEILFAKAKITHSYPHCWRCETPLLNYAASSWFVEVTKFKDELVANNQQINWVPAHIKEGRFGKWLLGARDWAISRSRFWGAPIPVWKCEECQKTRIVGAVADLKDSLNN